MSKYIFMNYWTDYRECILNAITDDCDTYPFIPFKRDIIQRLFELHNAWPFNKKRELPFKRIWFSRCLKGMQLSNNEEAYFLMYEMFHMTYSRSFLKYIRSKYPNSNICFVFSNPADDYNLRKLNKIRDLLDYVITFNEKDAKQYNFKHCPLQPFKVPESLAGDSEKTDLFFIGADKGRLEKLITIFEKAQKEGYKCEFYIVDVPEEKQKYADVIKYNIRLPYQEVLKKVKSTKCVLEILQGGQDYISIRTIEAMEYHKKLLTDSRAALKFPFYNSERIQIIESVETINMHFLEMELEKNAYVNDDFCSLASFKDYLSSM